MRFFNTSNIQERVNFKEAVLQGQPARNESGQGLYFPEFIPEFPKDMLNSLASLSQREIGMRVLQPYVKNFIQEDALWQMLQFIEDIFFPLISFGGDIAVLELFHGPTLAFKDVGAGFMSECFSHLIKESALQPVILVATSGDTGGAVAHAFSNTPEIPVVVLYPSGKVSSVQELQLTTHGSNVHALEVAGNFDDCQRMVKTAFQQKPLREKIILSSANSINIARWLPQQLYYLFAAKYFDDTSPVISVPSGNFGNLAAGLLAWKSGLPAKRFVAACNINDTIPEYLATGTYRPKPAKATASNAMDVGDPSNLPRILSIFNQDFDALKKMLDAHVVTDLQTRDAIAELKKKWAYIADPHGAVGYAALTRSLQKGERGYFLETAHPVKFPEIVERTIGEKIETPLAVQSLSQRPKKSTRIPAESEALMEFLENTFK